MCKSAGCAARSTRGFHRGCCTRCVGSATCSPPMRKLWSSVAFRLAVSCGLLSVGSMAVVVAVFYFGTVGVVTHSTDEKLRSLSDRLARHYTSGGGVAVGREIEQLLTDGIDQDTEVYDLIGPDGRKVA